MIRYLRPASLLHESCQQARSEYPAPISRATNGESPAGPQRTR